MPAVHTAMFYIVRALAVASLSSWTCFIIVSGQQLSRPKSVKKLVDVLLDIKPYIYLFTSINRGNLLVIIVFGFIPGRDLTSVGKAWFQIILLTLIQRYKDFIHIQ